MRNQLVYDVPVRVFHWIFAGLFIVAFLIAKTVDDETATYSYHMLAGLLLAFTVLLRIGWGFFGGLNSRFSNFALNPKDLVAYLKGVVAGDKQKWGGHNPASSWATLIMLMLPLGLATTGLLMATGTEDIEDVHELFANAFLIVVLLHVVGVVLHGLRHKDAIALSMVDGRKSGVPSASMISNTHSGVAITFVLAVAVFAIYLSKHYDGSSRTLDLFGATLQLGESEEHGHHHDDHEEENDEDANSDDSHMEEDSD